METKFQTSFIPKKPILAQESVHNSASTSIFMVIGLLLFLASIGAAGLTFVGKAYLLKAQEQAKKDLTSAEKRFNLPLIESIKKANLKIDAATKLVKNHIAVSEVLKIVGGLTAEKVRFTSFDFSAGGSDGVAVGQENSNGQSQSTYKIRMKGVTDTFNSVAWQSDVFGDSKKYGTNKVLKNPVLSDLSVDAAGNVTFNFSADISASDILYEKALADELTAGETNQ